MGYRRRGRFPHFYGYCALTPSRKACRNFRRTPFSVVLAFAGDVIFTVQHRDADVLLWMANRKAADIRQCLAILGLFATFLKCLNFVVSPGLCRGCPLNFGVYVCEELAKFVSRDGMSPDCVGVLPLDLISQLP